MRHIRSASAVLAAVLLDGCAARRSSKASELPVLPSPAPVSLVAVCSATRNEPAPCINPDPFILLMSGRTLYAWLAAAESHSWLADDRQRRHAVVEHAERLNRHRGMRKVNYPSPVDLFALNSARLAVGLLMAIAAAVRAVSLSNTIVIVDSGLDTVGGLDLRQPGLNTIPSSLAVQLKACGLLPDLADYQVVFSGLGDTVGRQPSLPLPQQTTLANYWEAICPAGGAVPCSVDGSARAWALSRSTILVPVVAVPHVTSVSGPRYSAVTTSPGPLLGWAALAAAALMALCYAEHYFRQLPVPVGKEDRGDGILALVTENKAKARSPALASGTERAEIIRRRHNELQRITSMKGIAHARHRRLGRAAQRHQGRRTVPWWHIGAGYGQSDSALCARLGARNAANRRLEDRHHQPGDAGLRLLGACPLQRRVGPCPGVGRLRAGTAEVFLTRPARKSHSVRSEPNATAFIGPG
jgi:hypothetical protein